ncbi:MAG: antibiotic biosynthesis monooxygenase [Sphingomonadales bacterium]|nr:antibiotic biosynthesis monooxygenase [Sphingomonadales bacterium]
MFLVLFRNRKRSDIDDAAYQADAAAMEALARAQPGFVSFKSYVADDGEVVALSEWADAEAARAWGSHPDHARVQARGRAAYYADYTLYTSDNPRTHRFERPSA